MASLCVDLLADDVGPDAAIMMSHMTRSGGCMWQGREVGDTPAPLVAPTADTLAKKKPGMPSSMFEARYDQEDGLPGAFKVVDDQGRIRVVTNFKQGYSGRAVERYPSGETYMGEYRDAKRHGRGQFTDAESDSLLVSYFQKGKPVAEGTKLFQPWTNPTAVRTYDGKDGPSIPLDESTKIIKNLRSSPQIPVPVSTGFSAALKVAKAVTPPPKPKYKNEYMTEQQALFKAAAESTKSSPPPRDAFLAKLEAAESLPVSPEQARRSLIPRIE